MVGIRSKIHHDTLVADGKKKIPKETKKIYPIPWTDPCAKYFSIGLFFPNQARAVAMK